MLPLRAVSSPVAMPSDAVLERMGAFVGDRDLFFGGSYVANVWNGETYETTEHEKGVPRENPFRSRIPAHDHVGFGLWRGYFSFWLAVNRLREHPGQSQIRVLFEADPFAEDGPDWLIALLSSLILAFPCDAVALEHQKHTRLSESPSTAEIVSLLTSPAEVVSERAPIVVVREGVLDPPSLAQILASDVTRVATMPGVEAFSRVPRRG
jgi:hypothetical protein